MTGAWLALGARLAVHHHHHLYAHTTVTVVLALLSALAFGVATATQQNAAEQVSDHHARGVRFFLHLIRSPRWIAGSVGNTAGYVLQAIALAYGSLLIVQPLLVTSLLFALPFGAWLAHRRLPRSVLIWAAVLAVSLAVFVTTGNANRGADHGSHAGWLLAAAVLAPVLASCLVGAAGARGATRASLLAVSAGLLGGVLAVLTKAVVTTLPLGVEATVSSWELYGLLAVGGVGIYVQQLSFQAGALHASLPIFTVLEPVVAAVLGLTLLHEKLRVGPAVLALLAVTVVVMAVSTVALARGEALLELPRADGRDASWQDSGYAGGDS